MEKTRQAIFPLVVLFIIIVYTFALFHDMPYLGFYYSYLEEITDVFVEGAEDIVGSQLLAVDGKSFAEMRNNIYTPLFFDLEAGDTIQLTLEQNGAVREIDWTLPSDQQMEFTARVLSTWWLPFGFWLAGIITWFNIRPRNQKWALLVAFNMLIALYLASLNGPSLGNRMLSVPLARFLGCMSFPVFLHLHWEFPRPLFKIPSRVIWAIYGVSIFAGLFTALNIIPASVSISFSIAAVIGTLLLLIIKRISQKHNVGDNNFILVVLLLIFLPPLLTVILYTYFSSDLNYFGFTGAYMAMPALPSAYFLIALQDQILNLKLLRQVRNVYLSLILISSGIISFYLFFVGELSVNLGLSSVIVFMASIALLSYSIVVIPLLGILGYSQRFKSETDVMGSELETRANFLLTPYLYLIFMGLITGVILFVLFIFNLLTIRDIETIAITGLLAAAATLGFYPIFRDYFDRRFFGSSTELNQLSAVFARQIATSLTMNDLAMLFVTHVLPAFLVRQSALYYINKAGTYNKLFSRNVDDVDTADLKSLINRLPAHHKVEIGPKLESSFPALNWVNIFFPLRLSGKLIGVWFLGQRDPDDNFTFSEIKILQAISNQATIALSNILNTIQLHEYYQAGLDRDEADRIEIARGLHDQVLNQLASLSMMISSDFPKEKLLQSYEEIKQNLRETILRIRPAVLDFGLSHAIHELSMTQIDQSKGLAVDVQLPHQSPRYPEIIENHVFNIVQQVFTNAIIHSAAENIVIAGEFKEGIINLVIEDDGIGFEYENLNFTELMEKRHFGLVGIRERAALIDATLAIYSERDQGTRIFLRWEKDKHD